MVQFYRYLSEIFQLHTDRSQSAFLSLLSFGEEVGGEVLKARTNIFSGDLFFIS